jgi:hypothetical protein
LTFKGFRAGGDSSAPSAADSSDQDKPVRATPPNVVPPKKARREIPSSATRRGVQGQQ